MREDTAVYVPAVIGAVFFFWSGSLFVHVPSWNIIRDITDSSEFCKVKLNYRASTMKRPDFRCLQNYMASTMKRPDFRCLQWNSLIFGDVFKIGNYFFFCRCWVSCVLQEFKLPPKFLGYLTDQRWSAPTVLK
jgi:hypothetical protein